MGVNCVEVLLLWEDYADVLVTRKRHRYYAINKLRAPIAHRFGAVSFCVILIYER